MYDAVACVSLVCIIEVINFHIIIIAICVVNVASLKPIKSTEIVHTDERGILCDIVLLFLAYDFVDIVMYRKRAGVTIYG
jgi:hypothetical protein